MTRYEMRALTRACAADLRDFLAAHRQSLGELALVLGVTASVAGGALLLLPEPLAPDQCQPLATFLPGSMDMPKAAVAEPSWNWPLAEETIPADDVATDEPSETPRRRRRHHHRG